MRSSSLDAGAGPGPLACRALRTLQCTKDDRTVMEVEGAFIAQFSSDVEDNLLLFLSLLGGVDDNSLNHGKGAMWM
ncbi:hypothetical protein VTJ04DRAFT_9180 [Mycothermus thermophilus]|uniref:uncharacterized protein n=1 Tax=Humicola insolens TaxID=85995 RepID=UPI0037440797